jgi:hypothetical protein
MTEMGLLSFAVPAVFMFAKALKDVGYARRYSALGSAPVGLAFMTKSPVDLLPYAAALVYCALSDRREKKKLTLSGGEPGCGDVRAAVPLRLHGHDLPLLLFRRGNRAHGAKKGSLEHIVRIHWNLHRHPVPDLYPSRGRLPFAVSAADHPDAEHLLADEEGWLVPSFRQQPKDRRPDAADFLIIGDNDLPRYRKWKIIDTVVQHASLRISQGKIAVINERFHLLERPAPGSRGSR